MRDPHKRNEEYTPPSGSRPTRIVAAAVLQDGRVWTGERHGFIIPIVWTDTGKRVDQDQQGFWTDDGRFVTRTAARAIACRYGQLRTDFDKVLLSEHLW